MSETKHKSAPRKIKFRVSDLEGLGLEVSFVNTDNPETVADAKKQAHLLNAGQEMYEALKAAGIWAGTILALYPDHVRDGGNVRDDVLAIDAAIAKAEGCR